jgi:predicted dehydrogenase
MILAKCCHDTDIIQWLMGKKCTRVHSFGNLSFFNKEHQPEGAPSRCTEDCPHREECIYDVKKMYIENQYMGSAWFKDAAAGFPNATDEEVWEAIQKNNYGTCIFEANNNVVDHQVVNMEFEGGSTATLTMTAFTGDASGRCMKIFGTKGTLEIRGDAKFIYYTKFGQRIEGQWGDRISEEIDIARKEDANGIGLQSGHGGGDAGLMQSLYEYFTDTYTGNAASTAEVSYLNHLISFGAEESRVSGTVVDIAKYSDSL